jgi:peptide/nickel transport system permease protein
MVATMSKSTINWERLAEEWESERDMLSEANNRRERIQSLLRQLLEHRFAAVAGVILSLLLILAIFAPYIAPYDPTKIHYNQILVGPSMAHPMGTDSLGRDILSRVIYGTRIMFIIATVSVVGAFLFGSFVGAVAGYFGGRIDTVVQYGIDLTWSFPSLIVGLALASILAPSLQTILLALMVVYWGVFARLVRGETLSLREKSYVQSAQAIGLGPFKIIRRHIMPNAIVPAFVLATLQMGNAIAVAASLSYLGLGIQPPQASWGVMLSNGQAYLDSAWWVSTFPGLAIVITILAFNFLGEGLRTISDPKLG